MKKHGKTIAIVAIAALLALALGMVILQTAGGNADVVAAQSIHSFDAVLKAIPASAKADAGTGGWVLTAPDGGASFHWGGDIDGVSQYSAMLVWDTSPFEAAGLDITKLSAAYTVTDGLLRLGAKDGDGSSERSAGITPLAAYESLVTRTPGLLNFHLSLDHFGIKIGEGNLFEWARDLVTNTATQTAQDKDIVFVLNPEPLIAAGVDPYKVVGWAYAQVEVMQNNTTIKVYKFLKAFDLGVAR